MAFRRRRSRKSDPISSRPLRVDLMAASADPTLPAFLARPEGSPVYTGFPVIEGSEVDGFRLGMITDFEAKPGTMGDAFVVAPDNSRAGPVWESEVDEPYCNEVGPPDATRWCLGGRGSRTIAKSTRRADLRQLLPELRPRWEAWRARR